MTSSQAKAKCQSRPSARLGEADGSVAHSGKPRTPLTPSVSEAPSQPSVLNFHGPILVTPQKFSLRAVGVSDRNG